MISMPQLIARALLIYRCVRKYWTPCTLPFRVTQGHRRWHRLIGSVWLLLIAVTLCSHLVRFRVNIDFGQKPVIIHTLYLTLPLRAFCLWNLPLKTAFELINYRIKTVPDCAEKFDYIQNRFEMGKHLTDRNITMTITRQYRRQKLGPSNFTGFFSKLMGLCDHYCLVSVSSCKRNNSKSFLRIWIGFFFVSRYYEPRTNPLDFQQLHR